MSIKYPTAKKGAGAQTKETILRLPHPEAKKNKENHNPNTCMPTARYKLRKYPAAISVENKNMCALKHTTCTPEDGH